MGTYAESAFHEDTSAKTKPTKSRRLALVAVFSAVIAVCTIIAIPLPPPLFEITLAPAVYLALAALVDKWDAFSATAIGGFVGELFNITTRGGSPIYPFGMVWARAPEVSHRRLGREQGEEDSGFGDGRRHGLRDIRVPLP